MPSSTATPTKQKPPQQQKKRASPPRENAKIINAFQSGIREFRGRSPIKNRSASQKDNNKNSTRPPRSTSPSITSAANATTSVPSASGRTTSPSSLRTASSEKNRRTSSAAGLRKGVNDQGHHHHALKNIFSHLRDFTNSTSSPTTRTSSTSPSRSNNKNPFAKKRSASSIAESNSKKNKLPFYSKEDVSPLWIALHARIVETKNVEKILRKRIEDLYVDQVKVMAKHTFA